MRTSQGRISSIMCKTRCTCLLRLMMMVWTILLLMSNKEGRVSCSSSSEEGGQSSSKLSERFKQALSFGEAFSVIWGQANVITDHPHPSHVQLTLDKHSGSGFVSLDNYKYAYYSAAIKLPRDYTAGIVLAFYTSNGDDFPKTHDELDFEFLGNVKGKPWRLQTNIYGDGSVSRGREERFNFWFDPTSDFHNYSILWNHQHIVFMVDDVPIREMRNSEELGKEYPSKPMALYATMWDGSGWATSGGKYPVDYKYAPFITSFRNFKMEGCASNPIMEEETEGRLRSHVDENCVENPAKARDLWALTPAQQHAMQWVRTHYLFYTYCQDSNRPYAASLPDCLTHAPIKLNRAHGSGRGHRSPKSSRPRALSHAGLSP